MRAVVLRSGRLLVDEVAEPSPATGQLLVEPLAVGVCGSDLSAWQHTDAFLESSRDSQMEAFLFDPGRDLVFGHEFTARVLEVGSGVSGYAPGDTIVALPTVIDSSGVGRCVGYSTEYPGALAERVVVQAWGHLKVPHGVSPVLSAITEPLATGVNAVRRSAIGPPDGAIVIGCGPVGLGAVIELAQRGVEPVVASDPSEVRRSAAEAFGAHITVDPTSSDPIAAWRSASRPGASLFVYEASGVPGMLNRLIHHVPPHTRVTVAGACMVDDVIRPVVAVNKNITLDFITGPGRDETTYTALATTFGYLCDGRFDPHKIVTGYTGLAGVPGLFEKLRPGDPRLVEHVKVLVRHDLMSADIVPAKPRDDTPAR